jgi:hypothetical protein
MKISTISNSSSSFCISLSNALCTTAISKYPERIIIFHIYFRKLCLTSKTFTALLKNWFVLLSRHFYSSHCYSNKCRLDVSACLEFQSHNWVREMFVFHRGVLAVFALLGFCNARTGSLLPTFRGSVLAPSSRVTMSKLRSIS